MPIELSSDPANIYLLSGEMQAIVKFDVFFIVLTGIPESTLLIIILFKWEVNISPSLLEKPTKLIQGNSDIISYFILDFIKSTIFIIPLLEIAMPISPPWEIETILSTFVNILVLKNLFS